MSRASRAMTPAARPRSSGRQAGDAPERASGQAAVQRVGPSAAAGWAGQDAAGLYGRQRDAYRRSAGAGRRRIPVGGRLPRAPAAEGTPYKEAPARMRRITVEEAAALQTFPAGMSVAGPQVTQYRQIGNAVPPKLAFDVARAVREALERSDRSREFELAAAA